MKRVFILRAMITGGALVVSLWAGVALAEERFGALVGSPATALSRDEMAAIQGRVQSETIPLLGDDGLLSSLTGENNGSFTFFTSSNSSGMKGSSKKQNRGQNRESSTSVIFSGPLDALMGEGENQNLLGTLGLGGSNSSGERRSFTFKGSGAGVTLKRMGR